MSALPRTLGVVGLGLMGASLARAARRADPAVSIVAVEPREDVRAAAVADGVADTADAAPGPALGALRGWSSSARRSPASRRCSRPCRALLPDGAVLTDVGGAKERILALARERVRRGVAFVGAHPMFGGHGGYAGAAAAAEQWSGGTVAVCTDGDPAAVDADRGAATARSARGRSAARAAEHDAAVAMVSHLPYLVASALASAAREAGPLAMRLAGPGLADMTRLAQFPFDVQGEVARRNAPRSPRRPRRLERHLARILAAIGDSPEAARAALEAARAAREELFSESASDLACRRTGPLRGDHRGPRRQVDLAPRAPLRRARHGETRITGLLDAEDVHSTRKAVEALGASVRRDGDAWVVRPARPAPRARATSSTAATPGRACGSSPACSPACPGSPSSPATPRCGAARSAA